MEQMFVCQVCGMVSFGSVPAVCPVCFAPKEKFKEDAQAIHPAEQEGKEKHVPVLTAAMACGLIPNECKDVHVKVGSVVHPMKPEHWIQWIDVYVNNVWQARYQMRPESLEPAVGLHLKSDQKGTLRVVEKCNVHGRWMAEVKI